MDSTKRHVGDDIDRDLREWSANTLHATYLRYGSAVIRNAVDLAALDRIEALATRIYARKPDLHIYDEDFAQETAGQSSMFDLLAHPIFAEFLDRVYARQTYTKRNALCRRIRGTETNSDWQHPLDLHLDSQVHRFPFTVNFWIPFQDSGEVVAGIQFLPIDYRATRMFCGFAGHPLREPDSRDKWGGELNHHYFAVDALSQDRINATYGDDCLLHPKVHRGDLVVLSNWIVHGTYRTPAMANGRMNAELRFIGNCLDIAG